MPTILRFGIFRLDAKAEILFRGAAPTPLGRRGVALLRVLVERAGVPVSKDALIEAAWLGRAVEESNLTVQIAALRRVLGEDPGGERWIETLPRRGYRFVGPVVVRDDDGAAVAPQTVRDADAAAAHPAVPLAQTPQRETECRQLTILSCELVATTAPSDRMNLDDLCDAIRAFRSCIAETVGRFNALAGKHVGNTVLVYFGCPAHEHDAEQAVRAGLALCSAMGALVPSAAVPLRCRVGIATGPVIVGDPVGVGDGQERAIVGDALNIAMRLQASAQPDTVAIDQTTRRLIGNLFDCRDLGAIEMTGAAGPVPAWQVLGAGTVESRFEALRSPALTPLVGREEELELLERRWRQATHGSGRLVLISGEPGIGKSRLAAALQRRLAREPHADIRYSGSPHHQGSVLYPVISHLEHIAAFARDDSPEQKLDKLAALLGAAGAADGDISLIAELMSLPGGERYPPLDLGPQRKRERSLAALLRQLEAMARRQPVLITFEDLHWIDLASRELLDLLVERIDRLSLLLVATCRPEFQAPWTDLPAVTLVALNRLGRRDAAVLVRQIAGNAEPWAPDVLDEIVERTDGVPLFVEELTKAVLESGGDRRPQMSASVSPSSRVIPPTLHASLMARLDRLGPAAKQVAQMGAAIGKEFSYELLATAGQLPEPLIQGELQRLVAAGLLFQRGPWPQASFVFKHALVQDVAYATLLRRPREDLHARIAAALEQHFPDLAGSQPELLAHHFANAGVPDRAAGYFLRAGEIAIQRSALVEAMHHLERGLRVLESAPRNSERVRQELDLHLALGAARSAAFGYAAHAVLEAYTKARCLCEELGDTKRLYEALVGQYRSQFIGAERGAALRTAEQILRLARDRHHRQASLLVAMSLYQLGRLEQADYHVRQSLSPCKSISDRVAGGKAIQDGRVTASVCHSMLLYQLGYLDQAEAQKRAALARARSLSHPYTLAFALAIVCETYWFCDEDVPLIERARELVTLSAERGFSFFLPFGLIHLGRAMVQDGRAAEGIAEIEQGIASYRATGASWTMPYHLGLLAWSHGESARPERGLDVVEEALETVQRTDEHWFEPELHRIKGELYALLSREPEAEAAFREAARIARDQRAKLCELRACMSHARLWVRQGRRKIARDLLAPVHGWFSEGLGTRQLREAKALLDSLTRASKTTCSS